MVVIFRNLLIGARNLACLYGVSMATHPIGVGRAAEGTLVTFADGYATPEEQAEIREILARWETPLRNSFPRHFSTFNGWRVTDVKGSHGLYDPRSKEIRMVKDFEMITARHEFCHHISENQASFNPGVFLLNPANWQSFTKASGSADWIEISCEAQGWMRDRPGNCLADLGGFSRNTRVEEELASACSRIIDNPSAAPIFFSDNPNTLAQARFISRMIGLSDGEFDEALGWLHPAEPRGIEMRVVDRSVIGAHSWARPDAASHRDQLRLSLDTDGDGENDQMRGMDYREFHHLVLNGHADGSFGHIWDDRHYRVYLDAGKRILTVKLPRSFELKKFSSYDHRHDGHLLSHGSQVWRSREPVPRRSENWEVVLDEKEASSPLQGLFTADGIAIFGREGYWLEGGDLPEISRRSYPEAVQRDLASGRLRAYHQGDEIFLWISDIPLNRGSVSRLYRVKEDGRNLEFEPLFAFPTLPETMPPLRKDGEWYLASIGPDGSLRQAGGRIYAPYGIRLFRVDGETGRLTPIRIDDSEKQKPMTLLLMSDAVIVDGWFVVASRYANVAAGDMEMVHRHLPDLIAFRFKE